MPRNLSTSHYRPEIDGLRAFAVVAVIINHFNKNLLPSGYLGVDIFFVISGYVITASLVERESKDLRDFITAFYERRMRRIVPALVVFVLITSVLICLFIPTPEKPLNMGWRSLLAFSNIQFYKEQADYFSPSTELNPFLHTWSLGVEEQFYLLFPLLVWFSGFAKQTAKGARHLLLWVGTLSLASLASFLSLYPENQLSAYFLMPCRFWELAAGCLLFIGFQKRARIQHVLDRLPPLLVIAAMVAVMFRPVAGRGGTVSIVVLAVILMACLKKGTVAYRFLTLKDVVYVGWISYSLYLWHWTVLCISRWTIGIHWWSSPFQVGLMVLLAAGSYRWVETPYRERSFGPCNKFSGKAVSIVASSFLVLIGVGINLLIREFSDGAYLGGVKRGDYVYSETIYWNRDRCLSRWHGEVIPDEKTFESCALDLIGGRAERASAQIFWYGNSFNDQLMPAAVKIKQLSGLPMNSYAVAGCPATLSMEYVREMAAGYCRRSFRGYLDYFLKQGRNDSTLIVSSSPGYWIGDANDLSGFRLKGRTLTFGEAQRIYQRELNDLADLLRKNNRLLILTSGIPVLTADPEVCLGHWSKINNLCPTDFSVNIREKNDAFARMLQGSGGANGKFMFLDLYSPLEAKMRESNHPVFVFYFNKDHLSRQGALLLVPTLTKALTARS
jgi:peptidoglycan/LPS O-acetylase OafA/YrhL